MDTQALERFLLQFPVFVFAVVVHEWAHAWQAQREGDNTAAMLGRLTLNPVPHVDPIGSVLLPAILVLTNSPVMLGWAKPVPTNPRNYRNYRGGDIRVSLAGIVANLASSVAFALVAVLMLWLARLVPALESTWDLLFQMSVAGVGINLILALFNLLPIPPLDGSHVMYHLLPARLGAQYRELGRFGFIILFALLYTGALSFLSPVVSWLVRTVLQVAALLAP